MSWTITKETKWLCEHSRALERFSGKWVVFSAKEGMVAQSASLNKIIKVTSKFKKAGKPFVFHVPSKDELGLLGAAPASS